MSAPTHWQSHLFTWADRLCLLCTQIHWPAPEPVAGCEGSDQEASEAQRHAGETLPHGRAQAQGGESPPCPPTRTTALGVGRGDGVWPICWGRRSQGGCRHPCNAPTFHSSSSIPWEMALPPQPPWETTPHPSQRPWDMEPRPSWSPWEMGPTPSRVPGTWSPTPPASLGDEDPPFPASLGDGAPPLPASLSLSGHSCTMDRF